MNEDKWFFSVNVSKYDDTKHFDVYRPSSINNPKNNSVMFIKEKYLEYANVFERVNQCLVFWPASIAIPQSLREKHAFVQSEKPHIEFCRFFKDNDINSIPKQKEYDVINGAFIEKGAVIGKNVSIFPSAYISSESRIGDNVYIGSGVKIMGEVYIGDDVVIRENSVIGVDGLTTDRDDDGTALTMPQFGYIRIEDGVQIGANVVIARGAIDGTVIHKGVKIDSSCFISHNTEVGENTFIVGEAIMFGSSRVGRNCIISGNSTIANFVEIGDESILGMGAVATKSIPEYSVAVGCPAKVIRSKRIGEEV